MPEISIIIPVVNESENLAELLPRLKGKQIKEIIVVDGGSADNSREIAFKNNVHVVSSIKNRAKQMNAGASLATGDILYFVHADCRPPTTFANDIIQAHKDYSFGCFRSLFDTKSRFLRFNSYFTRFKGLLFRGGGQTLWINKQFFHSIAGYNESLELMEEYDLIWRASRKTNYTVIPKDVLVSERTYLQHGHFKTQFIYSIIMFGFFMGVNQQKLLDIRKRFLHKKA